VACAVGAGLAGAHRHGFIESEREVFLAHAPLDVRSLLCTPFLGGATLVVLLALLARAAALAQAVLAALQEGGSPTGLISALMVVQWGSSLLANNSTFNLRFRVNPNPSDFTNSGPLAKGSP